VRTWFSAFPGGWPAVALLLLRLIVGVSALGQGVLCLTQTLTWMSLLRAALLIPCGLCVLIGFATPIASLVVAFGILVMSTTWHALPSERLVGCKPASFQMIAISLSVAMLGPGSLSLDARLFGRREIVIPPSSRPKQF